MPRRHLKPLSARCHHVEGRMSELWPVTQPPLQEHATRQSQAHPRIHRKAEDSIPQREVAIQAKLNGTKKEIALQKFESAKDPLAIRFVFEMV